MITMKNEEWLIEKYNEICKTGSTNYCLLSLKIKRFRIFNRLYGRGMGDTLIKKVYEVINEWLGDDEYIAHINLNYYNVIMHYNSDYDLFFHRIIEMNRIIRDMPFEPFHGQIFSGMGIYPLSADSVDFRTAQYNADICRNECPENSFRNSHFEVYGVTYKDKNLIYFDLQQAINPALENEDFKLYLQPKVNMRTGEVTHAEALVRWIDPVKGEIPISEFLPVLEENGLIEELDLYIFKKVIQKINQWYEVYNKKIKISVNLSRSAFDYRYFFEDYIKLYNQNPCNKDCIEIELLESIVLNQVDRVKEVVGQIKDFGFSCSLDDFGSGYSSFSVLTNPDLSAIKIDRSLFKDESNPREKILLGHIIKTARELNLEIVAEGVENWQYVDFLRELGCNYIQGFVFYRPMPAEEFEERFLVRNEKIDLDKREKL